MSSNQPIPLVHCTQCQALAVPPQDVCRRGGGTDFKATEQDGRGTVYTCTTIRVAPEAYRDQAPYTIAIVELAPDLRVTARVVGESTHKLVIGQPMQFDRVDSFGYWFRPLH